MKERERRIHFNRYQSGLIPIERLARYFRRQLSLSQVYSRCGNIARQGLIRFFNKDERDWLIKGDFHFCQRKIFAGLSERQKALFSRARQAYLECGW